VTPWLANAWPSRSGQLALDAPSDARFRFPSAADRHRAAGDRADRRKRTPSRSSRTGGTRALAAAFCHASARSADDGFTARWEVSHLARSFPNTLAAAKGGPIPEVLDILFIDPVNVYLQSERAVKYGILFITLTFAGFFLSEILRRSPIHPLQYLLVGLALAVFFLLLIALSEHLPFVAAYAIAASACIALIGSYLAAALGGRRQGFAFRRRAGRTLRGALWCPALRGQLAADGQRAALPCPRRDHAGDAAHRLVPGRFGRRCAASAMTAGNWLTDRA
jgi:hypothetical protein